MSTFIDVARSYKNLKHQNEALLWLTDHIDADLWNQFLNTWRQQPAQLPSQGIITPELMHRLTGYPAASFDEHFCSDCNRMFQETGFDKHLNAMQMLMANMMHETCNFIFMEEIASGEAYNNRSDLSNGPHDGPKYKGAGVLMLTGKFNYKKLSDYTGDPRVMEGVDYVANTYPFTSAVSWIKDNKLLDVCLNQGFDACCVKINGGTTGIDDRRSKYKICQREMG